LGNEEIDNELQIARDEFSTAFISCYTTRSPTKKCTSEKFNISKRLVRVI